MADYLLLTLEDEAAHAAEAPRAVAELLERRAGFAAALRGAGQLRDAGRMRPSKEGKRVRRDGVHDGPFAEDGKALGGFYWVEAPDVHAAARLASQCPTLPSDEVDVRPLLKGRVDADKEARPGKIFAFAVQGSAATEAAWVEVMDTIDAETQARFPAPSFLGGVRLEPPTSGRRVATRGERRATFDGPFVESKEVIGGLFFLRLRDLDEAVRWACASRFVVHGALEIREVWRS
jgi:hypothetical protein